MRGVIRKTLGLAAGLLLLVPASALAGVATVENGIPRYDAYFGEANNVTVSEAPGPTANTKTIIFSDVVPVDADPGCADLAGNAVGCIVPVTTGLARAELGNQNDRIQPIVPDLSVGFSVQGDFGNDTLIGTQRRDVLDGVGGNDTLRGRSGNDALQGANGNDDLRGDAGLDSMEGGAGDDVLNAVDNEDDPRVDCGEDAGDDDFALHDAGDVLFANCERTQQG
jgi:Ca2+-binding RTX toxin-like protein